MTSYFDKNNNVQPVTVLQGVDLSVLRRLTVEDSGYSALVVAYNPVKKGKLNKPKQGQFDKNQSEYNKSLKELRMGEEYLNEFSFDKPKKAVKKKLEKEDSSESPEGEGNADVALLKEEVDGELAQKNVLDILSVAAFEGENKVFIQGKSKGKGFSGTIKVHNFTRGPETHGSKNTRRPGSIGAGTDPARVFKGVRMAKNLGDAVVTQVSYIVSVDLDKKLVFVRGAVPGTKNAELLLYC